jgi:hypothetical protein
MPIKSLSLIASRPSKDGFNDQKTFSRGITDHKEMGHSVEDPAVYLLYPCLSVYENGVEGKAE